MAVFALPEEKVRVVQAETGGAFGGKEEYPSMIAAHAALLAMKSGRPVKIIYDRLEDMVATTKRHPSRTRHRTAVSKDGKILGGEIEFTIDGGAYLTLSPVVLSRGTIHAGGPYYWPSVRVRAKAVATNAPPHGAFRGFGAPQSIFAIERHMDRIAEAVKSVAGRDSAPEFSEAGRNNHHRSNHPRRDRSGEIARPRTHSRRLRFQAPAFRAKPERPGGKRVKKGMGIASLSARCGFHRIGRTLLEFRGGSGRDRRRTCPRARFQHGNRAGNQHDSLPGRGRGAWACPMQTWRLRSRTRRQFQTAARQLRHVRRWSSGSWCSRPRSE